MRVVRVEEGLWIWSAPHPAWTPADGSPEGWPRDVWSTYVELPGEGILLVDPLVPGPPDEDVFWKAFDADVARAGGAVHVLLANGTHARSAAILRDRHGARTWAHEDAAPRLSARPDAVLTGARAELPGGVIAHRLPACQGGEVLVELPGGAGLVCADAVLGAAPSDSGAAPGSPDAKRGGLRISPSSWASEEGRATFQEDLRAQLRALPLRPFRNVLVSHGEPVLGESAARAAWSALLEGAF